MLEILLLIIMVLGVILFCYIGYLTSGDNVYKYADESCYFCIYSTNPHSIRDRSKNTCKIINNQNWTSTQIRNCKYRVKE